MGGCGRQAERLPHLNRVPTQIVGHGHTNSERQSDLPEEKERELLAYLELHPGQHNVGALESVLPKASPAARARVVARAAKA